MRKLVILGVLIASIIAFNTNNIFYAQETQQISLNQRIKMLESNLKNSNKLFKVIGENQVAPNGKVIQNITSSDSFEILALPLIEPADASKYPGEFIGKMFSGTGFMLSEVKSVFGIKVATQLPPDSEKKLHKFEFINPNNAPVKVKFYFVQDEKTGE